MAVKERYPLCWPAGWKRITERVSARFSRRETQYGSPDAQGHRNTWKSSHQLSVADALARLRAELRRMGLRDDDFIISTNVELRLDGLPRSDRREPSDPGVAVYWEQRSKQQCMATDRYDRVADNMAAIATTLDDLRSIERHGGAEILERAFIGFAQLPSSTDRKPWREVLGFGPEARVTKDELDKRFRKLAEQHHPDKGGNIEEFHRINGAREDALLEGVA